VKYLEVRVNGNTNGEVSITLEMLSGVGGCYFLGTSLLRIVDEVLMGYVAAGST